MINCKTNLKKVNNNTERIDAKSTFIVGVMYLCYVRLSPTIESRIENRFYLIRGEKASLEALRAHPVPSGVLRQARLLPSVSYLGDYVLGPAQLPHVNGVLRHVCASSAARHAIGCILAYMSKWMGFWYILA